METVSAPHNDAATLDSHGNRQARAGDILWLALITVFAGVLRTLYLDSQGITLDESFSIFLGRTSSANFLHSVWHSELNMVLYYLLLRGWMHFGHSEWLIRMLGVLLSTATVPAIYFLALRLFDRRIGIVAALLLAVHPYHLMLAQRARSYPLLILLVSLSSLYFVRGLQKPAWTTWGAFATLSAAAVYSHFFAVFVILAQLLSLVFLARKLIPWNMLAVSLALLVILLLPFALFLLTNATASHVAWVPDFSLQHVLWVFYSLTLSKARCFTYVALWCIAAWTAFRASSLDRRWPYQFTFAWLVVPVVLTIATSLVQPLLIERFLSICIPATVLLAAAGILQLSRWSRPVALGLLALIIFYSASAIRFYDKHPEFAEGWKEASNSILKRVQPGDTVIAEGLTGLTFDYYRDTFGGKLPPLARWDSFATPMQAPLPRNIWILGSVHFDPNWKGAVPGSAEAEVRSFGYAHRDEYCLALPNFDAGEVRVWQFRRCQPPNDLPQQSQLNSDRASSPGQ